MKHDISLGKLGQISPSLKKKNGMQRAYETGIDLITNSNSWARVARQSKRNYY